MDTVKKLRKKFIPIDIVYKPVKSPENNFFFAIINKIYQGPIEILVETMKNYHIVLLLNVTMLGNFLQEMISKKYTLKIVLEFREYFITFITKI